MFRHRAHTDPHAILGLALSLAILASTPQLFAQEVAEQDDRVIDEEPNQDTTMDALGTDSARSKWFFEDAELVLKPRTYYLHRGYDVADTRAGWALGGGLEFRSGWWQDRLRLGATLATSQKLYGPEEKDGTQLFKPGPESFAVVSEAFATVRLVGDHGIRVGRQTLDLPYLGKHDLRMIPNTFEAVGIGNKPGDGFAYMAGYVDAIKYKDSDEFIPMSEAAGAKGTDDGLTFWGMRYRMPDDSVYGVLHQRTPDLFHTTFAKAEKRFKLSEDASLWADVSWTSQSSLGQALIGDFSTHLISGRLEWVSGRQKIRLAASTTDEGGNIQKPYGNPANYLSIIINDFDRAGEDAFSVGYSYDFGQVGAGQGSSACLPTWYGEIRRTWGPLPAPMPVNWI